MLNEAMSQSVFERILNHCTFILFHVCVDSTDYQENASAFCTGICMFQERKPYSDCFDLCNWYVYTGHDIGYVLFSGSD